MRATDDRDKGNDFDGGELSPISWARIQLILILGLRPRLYAPACFAG